MTLIFFWQHIACVTEQAWYVFGNLDNKKAFCDGKSQFEFRISKPSSM